MGKEARVWSVGVCAVLVLGAALACKKGESEGSAGASTATPTAGKGSAPSAARLDYPGTADGLKSLLEKEFTKSDTKSTVAALMPSDADYGAVFAGDAADKVKANTTKLLASPPDNLGKSGDEIMVAGASVDDLKAGSGDAEKCPGGYKKLADSIKPGTTLYCTKVGSISYDAFVYVNGHWAWFPKAFRALRE